MLPDQDFQEPPQFAGLLYWDGVDAVGRPVIVVNADEKAASRAAAEYMLRLLEPIVIRVRLGTPPMGCPATRGGSCVTLRSLPCRQAVRASNMHAVQGMLSTCRGAMHGSCKHMLTPRAVVGRALM